MKKIVDAGKWIIHNFYSISMVVFIVIYIRWFRLTPLMFFNDPDGSYIVGLILLGLYSLFSFLIKSSKNRRFLKGFLLISATIFLIVNIAHVNAFFPSLEFTTKCNEKTYYITWMHPFGDYQWTFDNVTVWKSSFKYDSFFFGYSGGPYRIVCDEEKKEVNIIRVSNDVLVYTDGENPRRYDNYTGTQLGDHLYFLSEDWLIPDGCKPNEYWACDIYVYILYECDLDYKSCNPLLLQHTTGDSNEIRVLEANKTTNEINLFNDFEDNPDRSLIFTYGKHPRCYVEGCEILEK